MAKAKRTRRPRTNKGRKRAPPRRRLWRVISLFSLAALIVGAGYVAWLDYQVTSQFEGRRWSVPARVYARPLELYEGLRLSADNFVVELEAAAYQRTADAPFPGSYSRHGNRFRVHTRAFRFWDGREPSRLIRVVFDDGRVVALSGLRRDRPLTLVRLDPAHIGNISSARHEDRILVRLSDVPRTLVAGLIAVEDHRFLEHHGISLIGIARAFVANLKAGRIVQGGSTLTQQLVKNFYLSSDRTLWRKANEAIMAVLLELHYSKREILEAYLNEVYLAQDGQRAIHGFGLASRFFFGRPVSELTLSQQALLIGMVKGPSYYDPRRNAARALDRRNLVLDIMARRGVITPEAAAKAKATSLGVVPQPPAGDTEYPAFMDLVRRHLQRDYREQDLVSEGLRIFTTLVPHVQRAAEEALTSRLARWSDKMQGAVVVVNVDDGEVEAVVGGRKPRYAGFNRALDARRQVGSLIKPAVYLTALARPGRYGLGTLLADKPVKLQSAGGRVWTPENYDHEWHGQVPLWRALANSYNVPTVRLGLDVGLRAVVDTLDRLGAPVPETVYPSLLLGAVAMTPIQVAGMYETLATGGFRTPLRAVRAVMTADGEVLTRYPLEVYRAFEPEPVYLVNHALQRVVAQGTAEGLKRWVDPALGIAGKTGTTDGLRDSWFAGFSGDTLAVVWVGRDDSGRTGLTGSSGAMTVWGEMFSRLQVRPFHPIPPEGVKPVWIEHGRRAASYCEGAVRLPYVAGTAPSQTAECVRSRNLVERAGDWLREVFD